MVPVRPFPALQWTRITLLFRSNDDDTLQQLIIKLIDGA